MLKSKCLILGYFFLVGALNQSVFAHNQNDDKNTFNQIFTQWTNAFNHQDLTKTCGLFSKELIFEYQGQAAKNYADICHNFKTIFNQTKRLYQYKFKIHDIYPGKYTTVRITWFFDVYENKKLISSAQEEGMDVLQKESSGAWKIIRSFSYASSCKGIFC